MVEDAASKTGVSRLQQGAVLDHKGFHIWDPIQIFYFFQGSDLAGAALSLLFITLHLFSLDSY